MKVGVDANVSHGGSCGDYLNTSRSIDDRLADVYDLAGAYLTACDQVDNADPAALLEAICRRDAAFAELRAARYPDQHA